MILGGCLINGIIISGESISPSLVPTIVIPLTGSREGEGQVTSLQVLDIDNKTIQAKSLSLDEKGIVTVETAEGARSLDWQKIVEVVFPNPAEQQKSLWEVVLNNNNDVLYGEIKEATKDGFVLASPLLDSCEIQFENILMIKSPDASGVSAAPATEDIIQLQTGDRDKGVINQIGTGGVKIQSSIYQKERSYELKDILWITLSQLAPAPEIKEGPIVMLVSRDGGRLIAQVKKIEKDTFYIKSAYGKEYNLSFDHISCFYTKTPRNVYLSDLEPVKVREYSPLDDPDNPILFLWKYQKDRSVVNKNIISLKGRKFYKGLGVHANCELTYRLDGQYQKFFASIGLDDESGPQGGVRFMVYLDGKKSYDSGLIKWNDAPKDMELTVTNVKEMKLVLDAGEDKMYTLDRAAWANARLTR